MEIRIAEIDMCGDKGFVVYPCPAPDSGPAWMILNANGVPVCVDETGRIKSRRKRVDYVDPPRAAAIMAFLSRAGGPLEDRLEVVDFSALQRAEELGWLARVAPRKGDAVFPTTRVWFPDGPPAELHRQACGDLSKAMAVLADAVRRGEAVDLSVWRYTPTMGKVVTAAELAAGGRADVESLMQAADQETGMSEVIIEG